MGCIRVTQALLLSRLGRRRVDKTPSVEGDAVAKIWFRLVTLAALLAMLAWLVGHETWAGLAVVVEGYM